MCCRTPVAAPVRRALGSAHLRGRQDRDRHRHRHRDRPRHRAAPRRARGAVIGFTRAVIREAGPDGTRANAVAPGAFPTAATEIHADQEGLWRDLVTGQMLLVDGGWMVV
jgi:NAD(P)-dependent dehydrogenase (short-subunit alcohol dehydrogenase family)